MGRRNPSPRIWPARSAPAVSCCFLFHLYLLFSQDWVGVQTSMTWLYNSWNFLSTWYMLRCSIYIWTRVLLSSLSIRFDLLQVKLIVLPPFHKGWHGFELKLVQNRANLYRTHKGWHGFELELVQNRANLLQNGGSLQQNVIWTSKLATNQTVAELICQKSWLYFGHKPNNYNSTIFWSCPCFGHAKYLVGLVGAKPNIP